MLKVSWKPYADSKNEVHLVQKMSKCLNEYFIYDTDQTYTCIVYGPELDEQQAKDMCISMYQIIQRQKTKKEMTDR